MTIVITRAGWPAALLTATVAWTTAVVAGAAGNPEVEARVADAAVLTVIAAVGALILSARPRHRIGWLLLAGSLLWAVGGLPLEIAVARVLDGADNWWTGVAVVAFAIRAVGYAVLVTLLPLHFPTGTLPSPRWRKVERAAYVVMAVSVIGIILAPRPVELRLEDKTNPLGIQSELLDIAFFSAYVTIFVLGAIGFVAVALRWRRGDPLVRQQISWFVVGMIGPPLIVLFIAANSGDVRAWLYPLSVAVPSVAIGIAVLQHRLYDVPVFVNRTLVYALLTAAVVGIYVLVVAGVGAMLGTQGSRWLSLLGAATVAVAFQPVRAVLQRAVNRIAYGSWQEPYEVLGAMGSRLAAGSDPQAVLPEICAELSAGLRLRYVGVLDNAGKVLGESGTTTDDHRDTRMQHQGEVVGTLRVAGDGIRAGRQLRDERLLETLAQQLAPVVRAVSLTGDLRRSREALVLSREDERRRLRRDLHDGLGPSLAALTLKVDTARNTLGTDPDVDAVLLALRRDVQDAVADVRRVVENLRPPALDELGLAGAVAQLAQRLAQPELHIEVDVPAPLPPLRAAVEVAAYRIAAEAVTNVSNHSGASRCTVVLATDRDLLHVAVEDDGRGFNGHAGRGNGLATMRERAEELGGTMRITTKDTGTVIDALLPIGDTVGGRQ